jgi:catechol 2,3-dioxygenase-like lactoylglutathione lyase family enzyme
MKRAPAFLAGILLGALQAHGEPVVDAVNRIVIPVSKLDRALGFYSGALSFVPIDGVESPGVVLRLGGETIELVPRTGRQVPSDFRSNDRWFQHLAIVVSDIDRAYAIVLRQGATSISAGPQELPAWNPDAGGIRAVYFRDPDGHPLELIQFPRGKGAPRWQEKGRLFLGIDRSAIAVEDTEPRLAFYRGRLGLRIAGRSENWGIEQERLSGVPGVHVRITGLRAPVGPGIEFLQYLMPTDGRSSPADTRPEDLWSEVIVMHATDGGAGQILHDPDGHALLVEAR